MFKPIATTALTSLLLSTPAHALSTTLSFEGFDSGYIRSTTLIEGGYTLTAKDMWAGDGGSTGINEMERRANTQGTLTVARALNPFSFVSIDFQHEGRAVTDMVLTGFLNGRQVGSETFSTSDFSYQTFKATSLGGKAIDSLIIAADRDFGGYGSFDTLVVKDVVPIPLPAAGWLLLAGLGGLGAMRRRTGSLRNG